jgi:hypothetical protein
VSEPKISGFVPKWFRNQPLDSSDEVPVAYGSVPDQDPRVVTRLVPKDHSFTLPARTVSRVIDLKQDLAFHAARDVVEGFNPNFADLTSLSKTLRENATLSVEPAEPGSYVIPASLPIRSIGFDADAVLRRYAELLSATENATQASTVSIGALQVCRELGRLLRRDVEFLEVTTYDRENTPRPKVSFNTDSVNRLNHLLDSRKTTTREFEKITGRLEALDIGKNEFQLKIAGRKGRVKGTAAFFAITSLREMLGSKITLEGEVVRERKSVVMTAYRVVEEEDE